jgi:hypothetical protein
MSILESLVGMLIFVVGCGFLIVGCSMVADNLRWRLQAQRVTGTLIGVRDDLGSSFSDLFAVYRYVDALGNNVEVASQSGADCPRELPRGPSVQLLALRNPHRVREANGYVLDIAGPVFIAAGLPILYVLLRSWSWPIQQMLAFAAVIAALTVALTLMRRPSRLDPAPIQPRPDGRTRGLLTGIGMVICGIVFVGAGAIVGRDVPPLGRLGLHTSGTVIRMNESRGSNGTSYFAVVRFNTASGATVEFKDNIGNSPAFYSVGEQVHVSYLQSDPATAIIDRGIRYSIFPLLLAVIGLGTILRGIFTIRSTWGGSSHGSASESRR